MPQHELPVVLITQAKRFAQSTHCAAARPFPGQLGGFLAGACVSPAGGYHAWVQDSMRRPVRGETIRRPARGRTVRGALRGPSIADRGEPMLSDADTDRPLGSIKLRARLKQIERRAIAAAPAAASC
jgi:hypothetical protein